MTYDFSQITEVKLARGKHKSPESGLCFMEMAAWFAGEKHSDRPECACPVLGAYGIQLNDAMPDGLRDRLLKPLVPQIVGTRDKASEQPRAEFLAMWVVNKVLPIMLRDHGFETEALACERAMSLSEAAAATATAANTAAAAYAANAANAAAYAANAANTAAYAAYVAYVANAAYATANAEKIFTVAVEGLRQAIELGRHDGLMIDALFNERLSSLRELTNA